MLLLVRLLAGPGGARANREGAAVALQLRERITEALPRNGNGRRSQSPKLPTPPRRSYGQSHMLGSHAYGVRTRMTKEAVTSGDGAIGTIGRPVPRVIGVAVAVGTHSSDA